MSSSTYRVDVIRKLNRNDLKTSVNLEEDDLRKWGLFMTGKLIFMSTSLDAVMRVQHDLFSDGKENRVSC